MLITFRIPSDLKERIDRAVACGHYPDANSFAVVALENLLTAEAEAASSSESKVGLATSPTVPPPARSGKGDESISAGRIPSAPCFQWEPISEGLYSWVKDFAPDRFSRGDRVPLERWLFGQQNRVLPLKVNARLFASLLANLDGDPLMV